MTQTQSETKYIACVLGTCWVINTSVGYLSKIPVAGGMSIATPLFHSWFQCLVSVLICWLAGLCGQLARRSRATQYIPVSVGEIGESFPGNQHQISFLSQIPRAEYTLDQAKQILPLSLVFVGITIFNNLCLRFVEVSFYQVARSLTIVFTALFSPVFLGMKTSFNVNLCLVVIIFGFLIVYHGSMVDFSLIGTLSGTTASLLVALNCIFTKKGLTVVDDNIWKLAFYSNMNASFAFLPFVLYFEGSIIMGECELFNSIAFWMARSLTGFFGFIMGFVTVLLIKITSPLTYIIVGTATRAVQSFMSFYLWGNEPDVLGALGICSILGGCILYAFVKMNENAQDVLPPPPPQQEIPSIVEHN